MPNFFTAALVALLLSIFSPFLLVAAPSGVVHGDSLAREAAAAVPSAANNALQYEALPGGVMELPLEAIATDEPEAEEPERCGECLRAKLYWGLGVILVLVLGLLII